MQGIVNRYGQKCIQCGVWVEAGEGIAVKPEDKKWEVRCRLHCGETNGLLNPWRDQLMGYEMDYVGGEYTAGAARQRVNAEFHQTDALAEDCPNPTCDGTAWWRATVGARQCNRCRWMIVYRWDAKELKTERRIVEP